MEKLYSSKVVYIKKVVHSHFQKWLVGDTYPSLHLPRDAPGHKLQIPSKQSGIFQSLGTIDFVIY